jgi:cytochrome P450
VTDLIRAADAETALGPDDLMIATVALVSAAVGNLRGQLTLLLEVLVTYPDVSQRVRADHEVVPPVVEEGLRYAAQGDDIQYRVVPDTDLGGVRFAAGANQHGSPALSCPGSGQRHDADVREAWQ